MVITLPAIKNPLSENPVDFRIFIERPLSTCHAEVEASGAGDFRVGFTFPFEWKGEALANVLSHLGFQRDKATYSFTECRLIEQALAVHNAGLEAVARHGSIPP